MSEPRRTSRTGLPMMLFREDWSTVVECMHGISVVGHIILGSRERVHDLCTRRYGVCGWMGWMGGVLEEWRRWRRKQEIVSIKNE
jgi:hypothetical protein